MKVGFVNIFGKPNAGKSTFLNAILGERLAIVSSKVQTTRHRIKGIVTEPEYQIIFSDTPGIIPPKYKLQEKMMDAVKSALEDADVALLLVDMNDDYVAAHELFEGLRLRVPAIVILNKIDKAKPSKISTVQQFFSDKKYCKEVIAISALNNTGVDQVIPTILKYLPEGMPFFGEDELTDLPTRFFVSEMVREKIFELYQEEIPYHTTVLIREFSEKSTLTKIAADIIVQRETQKMILIGEKGMMIKKLGTEARASIEQFLDRKVFLELFVKVRPKWRDNDLFLKEYGYH